MWCDFQAGQWLGESVFQVRVSIHTSSTAVSPHHIYNDYNTDDNTDSQYGDENNPPLKGRGY